MATARILGKRTLLNIQIKRVKSSKLEVFLIKSDQEKVDPDHNKQSDSGIEGQQQPKQQSEEATTEHPTRDLPEHEQRGSSPQNDGQTEVVIMQS
mgnify:FL=1